MRVILLKLSLLKAFCEEVDDCSALIKRLQQKMNRSQRAMNPANFETDEYKVNANGRKIRKLGKVKTGAKIWLCSNKSLGGIQSRTNDDKQGSPCFLWPWPESEWFAC